MCGVPVHFISTKHEYKYPKQAYWYECHRLRNPAADQSDVNKGIYIIIYYNLIQKIKNI